MYESDTGYLHDLFYGALKKTMIDYFHKRINRGFLRKIFSITFILYLMKIPDGKGFQRVHVSTYSSPDIYFYYFMLETFGHIK